MSHFGGDYTGNMLHVIFLCAISITTEDSSRAMIYLALQLFTTKTGLSIF